jgi:hypothetical protein
VNFFLVSSPLKLKKTSYFHCGADDDEEKDGSEFFLVAIERALVGEGRCLMEKLLMVFNLTS